MMALKAKWICATSFAARSFEPLKDLGQFRRFRVDPEMQTLVWDNGADMAPEFLYEKMRLLA